MTNKELEDKLETTNNLLDDYRCEYNELQRDYDQMIAMKVKVDKQLNDAQNTIEIMKAVAAKRDNLIKELSKTV